MSLTSVNTILSDSLANLDGYAVLRKGRESDINLYSDRDKPLYWWLLPYTENFGNISNQNRYIESHPITIYIVNQDKESADNNETFAIIAACEILAQKLIQYVYEAALGVDQCEITGASIQHIIKFKAQNIYSGVALRFTISLPNTETIC